MNVTEPARAHHPVVTEHRKRRSEDVQLRVADSITKFAGSMTFVYVHIIALTVSLEAIFLSTFVMIGQNRQADFAQRKADHDFNEQELELKLNTEVTKAVHALAKEIHEIVSASAAPPKTT